MKRKLFKSLFAVAAIAAVGLGSYKAYGSYVTANMSEDDLLMMENVLALGDNVPNGTVSVINSWLTCYKWKDTGTAYVKGKDVYKKQIVDSKDVVNSCALIPIEEYSHGVDLLCWASTKQYSSCEQANLMTIKPNPDTRDVKVVASGSN